MDSQSPLTNDSSGITNVHCNFLDELRRRRLHVGSLCGMSYDLSCGKCLEVELKLDHQLIDYGTLVWFENTCRLILEEASHQVECSPSIVRVDWRCIFRSQKRRYRRRLHQYEPYRVYIRDPFIPLRHLPGIDGCWALLNCRIQDWRCYRAICVSGCALILVF